MNETIFFFFYNLAHRSQIFDRIIIFFAVYFPYIVIVSAGVFLLMHHEVFKTENPGQVFLKKKREILTAFVVGVYSWLLAYVLKILIHAPRPFDIFPQVHSLFPETDFSFPSGHATFFSALAFSLFFSHKKAGYIFMLFALVIGLARTIAGVHFPTDILAGYILGGTVAYLAKYV